MWSHSRTIVLSAIVFLAIFSMGNLSWGQNEITFAGVTHMVNPNGVYTNLGLGISVYPDSVTSACVEDPDNITVHCYSPVEFREEGSDLYYWIRLPGPPKEGTYLFTVNFTDGAKLFDRIIYAIGGTTPKDFLKCCSITLDETGEPIFDKNYESEVEGLFVAGDIVFNSGGSIAIALNHGHRIVTHILNRRK